ncbi:DinB family protein [Nocardiopsis sp. EMB25]|uniref:DinB family protein n=1 Tax=Nocardiopsis sp. EMB25 TaxID=2835867 RepID=UPI0022849223|nr:DinB family protein [Nocardiopsis sp. EMB25]MCY9786367.1 DinB family protein [Nocardiopsis sp. EMB25]
MANQPQDTTVDAERAALLQALEEARGNLRYTVRDLTEEQARRRTTASELCLGGIVKHMTRGERRWSRFMAEGDHGTDYLDPEVVAAHEGGFRMEDDETLADVLADYGRAAKETEAVVGALPDLDVRQDLPTAPWWPEGGSRSARETLLFIISETAQHSGHADIIRESLDGQKTMG